uniref:Acireductone dioxygenase n=1 Tax=Glossina pallidipes TaxID=7398 RepID=A0A1A9ZF26_GLOPL
MGGCASKDKKDKVVDGDAVANATENTADGTKAADATTTDQPNGDATTNPEGKDTMVDAAVLTKLEEGFAKLAASDSKSLLKKYLTKEIFDNLKEKKTPTFGSTLLDCIQSGLENHDSGVGIYAPDAEAYTVFADLFDPVIEDYHGGFKKTDKHPPREFGDVNCFSNLDPNNEFIISTRVRCGRSLQGYPFNPCLTEAQYKEMEEKVSSTLSGLEGELKGKFYPLTGMEKAVQQQLIDDHFLFKEGDRFLQTANACRYWPTGRGIYHNDNKTFLVWCNEEDHLRIISMQMGGDLGEVYRRLVGAVNEIEKRLPFSHDDRLGFLTFCPTNLGTTIRASVHIKVPKLAANKAKLEEVAGKYNLQVRGTRGEHTEAEGGVYDISNKRRMGLTEFDAVKEMNDGIAELIKLEKENMVEAWFMDDETSDQRLQHHCDPPEYINMNELFKKTGVEYFQINADNYENDNVLQELRKKRNYSYEDEITCSEKCLPDYANKLISFFTEHLHTDEEIRLVLDGSGYFDVRDAQEKWIRIAVTKGDLIIIPAGIYHRFTLDVNNYIKAKRYFVGEPVWLPYNRPADNMNCRKLYLKHQGEGFQKLNKV